MSCLANYSPCLLKLAVIIGFPNTDMALGESVFTTHWIILIMSSVLFIFSSEDIRRYDAHAVRRFVSGFAVPFLLWFPSVYTSGFSWLNMNLWWHLLGVEATAYKTVLLTLIDVCWSVCKFTRKATLSDQRKIIMKMGALSANLESLTCFQYHSQSSKVLRFHPQQP